MCTWTAILTSFSTSLTAICKFTHYNSHFITDFQCQNFPLDRTLLSSWTNFLYIPFFIQQWKILLGNKRLVCHLERQQTPNRIYLCSRVRNQHNLPCDPGSEMPGQWAQEETKDVLWKQAIPAFALLHPVPGHTHEVTPLTRNKSPAKARSWEPSSVPCQGTPGTHPALHQALCSPGLLTTLKMVTGLEVEPFLSRITAPDFKHYSSYFGLNIQMS